MNRLSFILDSNIFFSYYTAEDSLHEKSKIIMDFIDVEDAIIYLPYGVLLEVSTLLSKRYDKHIADYFVSDCLHASNIILVSPDIQKDAERFLQHSDRMAFVDHMLIHLAIEYQATLLTFDQQVMKRYQQGW